MSRRSIRKRRHVDCPERARSHLIELGATEEQLQAFADVAKQVKELEERRSAGLAAMFSHVSIGVEKKT